MKIHRYEIICPTCKQEIEYMLNHWVEVEVSPCENCYIKFDDITDEVIEQIKNDR